MASCNSAIPVVVALIIRAQEILVAQRNRGRFAGLWEFPGGKVEPGETPEQALIRELQEEINITALTPTLEKQYTYDYGDYAVALHVFCVTEFEGEPSGAEGQVVRWVDYAAFDQLDVLEATHEIKPLIAALISEL